MSAWVWTVISVLIVGNALYVAAEFGAVGALRNRIRRMSDDGSYLARALLPFIENPAGLDRYVGASQIGITLTSLTLGAYAQATVTVELAPVLADWLSLTPSTALSAASITILVALTAIQLVVGELVPKAIALQYPTQTALLTVLPMRWSLLLFRPVIGVLNGGAILLLRLLGSSEQTHRHLHSPEEIDLLIAESRDGGLLEPEEHQRLRRALHLGLRTARDLMVAIDTVTMLPIDASWDDVVRTVANSPFSRLPVYRGQRTQVAGILHVKDLVERYVAEGPLPLERLMRPAIHIAQDLAADRVITELRERRAHAAIVVDATGQALGLITIQDVLGELLGDRPGQGGDPAPSERRPGGRPA
jgi:CBS domain containing-hemolysin-like protein